VKPHFFPLILAVLPPALAVEWNAAWISVPGAPRTEYGVYHFRKAITLPSKPDSFIVHASADNRYQLYVNGRRVAWGPARGDLYHWRYETIDLAPHLRAGNNLLAAVVWNFGPDSPMAQVTNETGFLLQGDTAAERAASTGPSWKCAVDRAYSPIPVRMGRDVFGYYVAGPGERVVAAAYPWNWQMPDFDDSSWAAAVSLGTAAVRGARDAHSPWMLVPRPIPAMEEKPEPPLKIRDGGPLPLQVAPHSEARVLLDQGYYTTGYPELTVSGGNGAEVSLRYAESLYEQGKSSKGNRNEIEGKRFVGYRDTFVADGGKSRAWRPLWWRTWRYIELTVKTAGAPVTISSLTTTFSGYPFVRRAKLTTSDPAANAELQRMLDVSWRTLRVDAHETFMDCAYYEQLQYIGDTRLEALAVMTLSSDARLVKNALDTLNDTRTADGITQSRGPSRLPQYIPPFSLIWIGMLHDYWMYQDDAAFVRSLLPGQRAILSWFAQHRNDEGRLGALPWWNYVDWVEGWRNGVPPNGDAGGSAILDLLYLNALQWAAALEHGLGSPALAAEYEADAGRLSADIRASYWDPSRRLFADTPKHDVFSQHANSLAILAGLVKDDEARNIAAALIDDRSLTESTLYFRYYIHTALRQAGLGDRFLDLLGTWRDALRIGLETWPEKPEPSRSDAHAWSSHIAVDMFRTIAGIRPGAPGFARVIVEPNLGKLAEVSASMPHPKGEIEVALNKTTGQAEVTLPAGVEGELIWQGKRSPLKSGKNAVR
jgi:hypothetical protein